MKEITTYSDYFGKIFSLTDDELSWFHSVVARCKTATGCAVEIIEYNHDLYTGKSRDALGCCLDPVVIDEEGFGIFSTKGHNVSIYVREVGFEYLVVTE